jgi:hypothetical protein
MASRALSRPETVTIPLNRAEIFTLSDLRLLAITPSLLPAAASVANRFHPRTTLARQSREEIVK